MANLTMPIWQMTGQEFIDLLKENGVQCTKVEPQKYFTSSTTPPQYVYGVAGLAKLLKCSTVTVHKRKKEGAFDGCYWNEGRKFIFDANAIMSKQIKSNANAS